MTSTPDPSFVPPDARDYLSVSLYLTDWCAAQPERGIEDKIDELAGYAGCSSPHMRYVVEGDRRLGLPSARKLVARLGLPPEQHDHLIRLFEQPFVPLKLARARREQLLATVAKHQGLPWGAAGSLVADTQPDDAVVAALALVFASLDGDRPDDRDLEQGLIPPVTPAQLRAALDRPSAGTRLGARLWSPPPLPTQAGRQITAALLGFARDALLRLEPQDIDFHSFTATLDAEGSAALAEVCRWFEGELRTLCDASDLRVAQRVMVVLTQRLTVAGPFPPGARGDEVGWVDLPLPIPELAEGEAASDSAVPRPHPIGDCWFPSWVKRWRAWAKAQGLPTSDTWLSQETGLPRATVHDLCVGTTRFSSDHVYPFLKAFGLEKDKAAQVAFEGMAMAVQKDDPRQHAKVIAALRAMGAEQDKRVANTEAYFVRSQWYCQAILQLMDLEGSRALPGLICRDFGGRVDWTAAREALIALGVVGLLRRAGKGRVITVEREVRVDGPHAQIAQTELYLGMLGLYQAELRHMPPDYHPEAYVLALPDRARPTYEALLRQRLERIDAVLQAAEQRRKAGVPMDRVVLISQQSFPILDLPLPVRRPARKRKPRGA